MPRHWSLPNSVYDILATKLDSIAHDFPEGMSYESTQIYVVSTLDDPEMKAWKMLKEPQKRKLFSEIGLTASVRRIASKLLKKGELKLAREVLAIDDTSYLPEVEYTHLLHTPKGETVVLYFDSEGKLIKLGSLWDKVSFKYIQDESSRIHPDQIVSPERFHGMVKDEATLYIKV